MADRQQVMQTVEAGARWLQGRQNSDASFGQWGLGSTCLATLALIYGDQPNCAEVIGRAVEHVVGSVPPDDICFRALTVMMLVAANDDAPSVRRRMHADAQWLIRAQNSDPQRQASYGGWGEKQAAAAADGAHTYYAIMALSSAVSRNVPVPADVWSRAITWYHHNFVLCGDECPEDDDDGQRAAMRRCMVAAALAGLKTIGSFAADSGLRQIADDLAVSALRWLSDNYMVAMNPGFPESWYYYYLFMLTKACVTIPEYNDIEGKDWYDELADSLIVLQMPDGQWSCTADTESSNVVHTSFALLALSKAAAVSRAGTLESSSTSVQPAPSDRRGRLTAPVFRTIRAVGFPMIKTLEEFDFGRSPGINPTVFRRLASCDFIAKKENIVFIGESGTGKTHLATALGIAACRRGFDVEFHQAFQLANRLAAAQLRQQGAKLVKRLSRPELLIVDELSYFEPSRVQAELLFQVLSARFERASTIITTSLDLAEWTRIWRSQVITEVMVGRSRHQSYIFRMVGL